ncbi:MAG: hypothetical protein HC769_30070 [Cyanobacteria bacterium CRU_2_1]|nr:hypothetical protein [Cyanobacteria bacterium CRU_2_1]
MKGFQSTLCPIDRHPYTGNPNTLTIAFFSANSEFNGGAIGFCGRAIKFGSQKITTISNHFTDYPLPTSVMMYHFYSHLSDRSAFSQHFLRFPAIYS